MKRLFLFVLLGLLIGSPRFVSAAEDWKITKFQSDITVRTNASIDVHETIEVNFIGEHHGIFRDLPTTATFNGKKVALPMSSFTVQQDGAPAILQTSKQSSKQRLTIGDPDVLLTGVHTYDIRYHVSAAVNFFSTFDELNWNVTGNEWPVPTPNVTATIHIPGEATPTTLCYTGPKGSTAQACTGVAAPGEARYSATDNVTVISHWPKGLVTKPVSYDNDRRISLTDQILWWASIVVAVLMTVGTFWFMYRRWSEKGKDPEEPKTLIAQYEPPAGVLPAEATVINGNKVSSKAVTATIIDLAVRGYLRIEEREQEKLFGKKKDYAIIPLKPEDETLRDYERQVLAMFFSMPEAKDASGVTLLSAMKKHISKMAAQVESIRSLMAEGVNARGYFAGNPITTVGTYSMIAGICLLIPMYLLGDMLEVLPAWAIILCLGFIGASLSIGGFGLYMSRRTEAGAKAHWQIQGFKLYLTTAEKYRLQWQEDNHIFEKFLPYAIALGVAEKWAKTFADVAVPRPDWYSGNGDWNAIYAWHALNGFSESFTTSTVPSSGGSSGGGSGGGGGGGGGGAW